MNDIRYYVYIIKDNGKEVYVGKGSTTRCYQHKHADTPIGNLIRARLKEGVKLEIIKSGLMTEYAAFLYESFLIDLYKLSISGGTLLNQVLGKAIKDDNLIVWEEVSVESKKHNYKSNQVKKRKTRSDVGKRRQTNKPVMPQSDRNRKYLAKKQLKLLNDRIATGVELTKVELKAFDRVSKILEK